MRGRRGQLFANCLPLIAAVFLQFASVAANAETPKDSDIVVVGGMQKMSNWKRAETDHLVLLSDGGETELTDVAINLERLHQLMARLYGPVDSANKVKLRIVLFKSPDFFGDFGLSNSRSAEGPFAANLSAQRYYDPRSDGAVLAIARKDQVIDLNTSKAWAADCDDVAAEGGECFGLNIDHRPLTRKWEAVLYSAYAQHFILTYKPDAYPRWYIDGIGALFSTFKVRGDGSVDYGLSPAHFREMFRSYGRLKVADVLTGNYLETEAPKPQWSPYHAWLLMHFFVYMDPRDMRHKQFVRYMEALREGKPMAEAASVFGDMGKLQRQITSYANHDGITYSRTAATSAPAVDPVVTSLSRAAAASIGGNLALYGKNADSSANWSARLRSQLASLPRDTDALSTLAEAECTSGQADSCLATAEDILATAPNDVVAHAWKAIALTDQAISGPADQRTARLLAARAAADRALSLDSEAPLALIARFQSYARANEPVPDIAIQGLGKVIRMIPAAPEPRLWLGEELTKRGWRDLARSILLTIIRGPYESPEKAKATALLVG